MKPIISQNLLKKLAEAMLGAYDTVNDKVVADLQHAIATEDQITNVYRQFCGVEGAMKAFLLTLTSNDAGESDTSYTTVIQVVDGVGLEFSIGQPGYHDDECDAWVDVFVFAAKDFDSRVASKKKEFVANRVEELVQKVGKDWKSFIPAAPKVRKKRK